MSKPANNSAVIELHVPDFGVTKEFYGKLGFTTVWETKPEGFEGYMVMKMDNNIICFWAGNNEVYSHPYFKKFPKETPRGYAVEIIIFVEDIKNYYEKIKKFANVVEELHMEPWGYEDFRITDPFGFYIRVSSPYNTLYDSVAVK